MGTTNDWPSDLFYLVITLQPSLYSMCLTFVTTYLFWGPLFVGYFIFHVPHVCHNIFVLRSIVRGLLYIPCASRLSQHICSEVHCSWVTLYSMCLTFVTTYLFWGPLFVGYFIFHVPHVCHNIFVLRSIVRGLLYIPCASRLSQHICSEVHCSWVTLYSMCLTFVTTYLFWGPLFVGYFIFHVPHVCHNIFVLRSIVRGLLYIPCASRLSQHICSEVHCSWVTLYSMCLTFVTTYLFWGPLFVGYFIFHVPHVCHNIFVLRSIVRGLLYIPCASRLSQHICSEVHCSWVTLYSMCLTFVTTYLFWGPLFVGYFIFHVPHVCHNIFVLRSIVRGLLYIPCASRLSQHICSEVHCSWVTLYSMCLTFVTTYLFWGPLFVGYFIFHVPHVCHNIFVLRSIVRGLLYIPCASRLSQHICSEVHCSWVTLYSMCLTFVTTYLFWGPLFVGYFIFHVPHVCHNIFVLRSIVRGLLYIPCASRLSQHICSEVHCSWVTLYSMCLTFVTTYLFWGPLFVGYFIFHVPHVCHNIFVLRSIVRGLLYIPCASRLSQHICSEVHCSWVTLYSMCLTFVTTYLFWGPLFVGYFIFHVPHVCHNIFVLRSIVRGLLYIPCASRLSQHICSEVHCSWVTLYSMCLTFVTTYLFWGPLFVGYFIFHVPHVCHNIFVLRSIVRGLLYIPCASRLSQHICSEVHCSWVTLYSMCLTFVTTYLFWGPLFVGYFIFHVPHVCHNIFVLRSIVRGLLYIPCASRLSQHICSEVHCSWVTLYSMCLTFVTTYLFWGPLFVGYFIFHVPHVCHNIFVLRSIVRGLLYIPCASRLSQHICSEVHCSWVTLYSMCLTFVTTYLFWGPLFVGYFIFHVPHVCHNIFVLRSIVRGLLYIPCASRLSQHICSEVHCSWVTLYSMCLTFVTTYLFWGPLFVGYFIFHVPHVCHNIFVLRSIVRGLLYIPCASRLSQHICSEVHCSWVTLYSMCLTFVTTYLFWGPLFVGYFIFHVPHVCHNIFVLRSIVRGLLYIPCASRLSQHICSEVHCSWVTLYSMCLTFVTTYLFWGPLFVGYFIFHVPHVCHNIFVLRSIVRGLLYIPCASRLSQHICSEVHCSWVTLYSMCLTFVTTYLFWGPLFVGYFIFHVPHVCHNIFVLRSIVRGLLYIPCASRLSQHICSEVHCSWVTLYSMCLTFVTTYLFWGPLFVGYFIFHVPHVCHNIFVLRSIVRGLLYIPCASRLSQHICSEVHCSWVTLYSMCLTFVTTYLFWGPLFVGYFIFHVPHVCHNIFVLRSIVRGLLYIPCASRLSQHICSKVHCSWVTLYSMCLTFVTTYLFWGPLFVGYFIFHVPHVCHNIFVLRSIVRGLLYIPCASRLSQHICSKVHCSWVTLYSMCLTFVTTYLFWGPLFVGYFIFLCFP